MKLSFTFKIRYNDTVNNFYFKWNKEVHAQLRAFITPFNSQTVLCTKFAAIVERWSLFRGCLMLKT